MKNVGECHEPVVYGILNDGKPAAATWKKYGKVVTIATVCMFLDTTGPLHNSSTRTGKIKCF